MKKLNVVVLVSGSGSNLQAIIDATKNGFFENVEITGVISSNPQAFALERAKREDIPTSIVSSYEYNDYKDRMAALKKVLDGMHPDLIVLAGYLSFLSDEIVEAYRGQIINIHASLLPKYGGKGYYGIRIQEALLAAGDKEAGATVHFVEEEVDRGKIILQEKIDVEPSDTAATLKAKVLKVEHRILPEAIRIFEKARY